jgi:hypothetical protein
MITTSNLPEDSPNSVPRSAESHPSEHLEGGLCTKIEEEPQ